MTIRKRDRTREKLLSAAQALLLEGGFAALGIQQLTERAEVALGTIYNYFRTREEVAGRRGGTADPVLPAVDDAHHRRSDRSGRDRVRLDTADAGVDETGQ